MAQTCERRMQFERVHFLGFRAHPQGFAGASAVWTRLASEGEQFKGEESAVRRRWLASGYTTFKADGEDEALKKGFDKFQEEDGIYDSTDYIVTQITGEEK